MRPLLCVPRGRNQGPRPEVVLLMLAECHDFHLGPLGHPGTADCGQQMDLQCIRKHHGLATLELLIHPPNPGQASDATGIIVFGPQLGPLPQPTELVEPTTHCCGGGRDPACDRQCQGQRGTTPTCAAPAVGLRGGIEPRQQRPLQSARQHCGAHWRSQPTLRLGFQPQRPGAIRPHRAVLAGARAEQDGGDLRRVAHHRTRMTSVP
jgi:hypothetical protein